MTEREKLVELLSYFADGYSVENRHIGDGTLVSEIASYLIENGVIVPPCKAGDKVWIVLTEKGNNDWYIHEDRVERFVSCDCFNFCFSLKKFGYIYIDRQTNDLDDGLYDGRAYFNIEEAEKALAEQESD